MRRITQLPAEKRLQGPDNSRVRKTREIVGIMNCTQIVQIVSVSIVYMISY